MTRAMLRSGKIIFIFIILLGLTSLALLGNPASVFAEGGVTWSPNVKVNDDSGMLIQGDPILVADNSGDLHAAWVDYRNGGNDIYYSNSSDGGENWSANTKVNDGISSSAGVPSLAVDGSGTLYVTWWDNRNGPRAIFFSKSTDHGNTWSANIRINDMAGANASAPSLAIDDSGILYIAWHDNRAGSYNVYISKSIDGGSTWSPGIQVSDRSINGLIYVTLIVDHNGNLYAAWRSSNGNDYGDYLLSKSTDGGTTWSDSIRVNNVPGSMSNSSPAVLAADNGNHLYAAWHCSEPSGGWEENYVCFSKSSDGGAHWSPSVNASNIPYHVVYKMGLAVDADENIYVTYAGSEANSGSVWDLYFVMSTDGGDSWSTGIKVNDFTGSGTGHYWSTLAIDGEGQLYTSYQGLQNGNYDIYVSKMYNAPSPTGTPTSTSTETLVQTDTLTITPTVAETATITPTNTEVPTPESMDIDLFLRSNGGTANPSDLFLDPSIPNGDTPAYRDSAGVKFSGGNLWKEMGIWDAGSNATIGLLAELDDIHIWLGLKNSDDIGTRFDLRAEVYRNEAMFGYGEYYCITGVVRNSDQAQEVLIPINAFSATLFNGETDVLSVKIMVRIGTNGSGSFCGGHSSATGARMYFNASNRLSQIATP
ncbi:MAG: sialidase family protein [Anaerolineales bacterium]